MEFGVLVSLMAGRVSTEPEPAKLLYFRVLILFWDLILNVSIKCIIKVNIVKYIKKYI